MLKYIYSRIIQIVAFNQKSKTSAPSHSRAHVHISESEPHQLNYQEHIVLALRKLHFVQSTHITLRLWRRGFIEVCCIAHYLVTFTSRVICGKKYQAFFPPHPTGPHLHRSLTTPDYITYCTKRGQWRDWGCLPVLKALISWRGQIEKHGSWLRWQGKQHSKCRTVCVYL